MATGPEHYKTFEQLAAWARDHSNSSDAVVVAILANAHATAAAAAATADAHAGSMDFATAEAWSAVCGPFSQGRG